MFGYVRPYQSELRIREYRQYKAIYCQLCRTMRKEYGWLSTFSLNYDCAFYAMLALSVSGAEICEEHARCAANPFKQCRYLAAKGEAYQKAAALSVLLTYHKLQDDKEDEGFFKSLGCKLLLPLASRKAKQAAGKYPALAEAAQAAMDGQRAAERERAGIDACAEPTAQLLATVFSELASGGQALALQQFGYYLGRWVYLMDAADDLEEDRNKGKFNPFVIRLNLEGGEPLSEEARKRADEACNEVLNATVARMLPAFRLLELYNFGPVLENVLEYGLPELQREILFLHVKQKRRKGEPRDRI